MRRLWMVALVVLAAACDSGGRTGSGDMAAARDLAVASDLAVTRDLAGYDLRPAPVGPAGISDSLVLWLKPEAFTGMADGTAVAMWADASGGGHPAVQATQARQPTVKVAAQNGLPGVRFDGVDDGLGFVGTNRLSSMTIFVVYRMTSGATGNGYYPLQLGGTETAAGKFVGLEARNAASGDSVTLLDVTAGPDNDSRAFLANISAFDQTKIVSAVVPQMIHGATVKANGQTALMTAQGTNAAMDVALGDGTGTARGGVGGTASPEARVFKGDVMEVLVYGRTLPVSEVDAVEAYLNGKFKAY